MSTEAAVILKEVVSAKATKYAAFIDYKESDAHWLPKIPSHWQMKRLRFAVEFPKKSETRNLASVAQVSFAIENGIGIENGRICSSIRMRRSANDWTTDSVSAGGSRPRRSIKLAEVASKEATDEA
jgi:hypothetical protein